MPVFDIDQWLSSLKTEVPGITIPEEEIRKGFMRQDAFSRRQQQLDGEHKQRMATEDKFHADLLTVKEKVDLMDQLELKYGPVEQWSDTLARSVGSEFPGLGSDARGRGARSQGFDLDQVQALISTSVAEKLAPLIEENTRLNQRIEAYGQGSAVMIDFMAEVPGKWRDAFGSPFPKKEFTEFFSKSGTNDPYIAFQLFQAPYAETKRTEDTKAAIEAAEQKGYQSAMSKHGITELPTGAGGVSADPTAGLLFKGGPAQVKFDASGRPEQAVQDGPSHEERRAKVGKSYVTALDNANSGQVPGAQPGS